MIQQKAHFGPDAKQLVIQQWVKDLDGLYLFHFFCNMPAGASLDLCRPLLPPINLFPRSGDDQTPRGNVASTNQEGLGPSDRRTPPNWRDRRSNRRNVDGGYNKRASIFCYAKVSVGPGP
ncbi:hypothetical protein GWI33_013753 [Rhynchophorus ferrugineus]|uniref:Uncharacterized protein n=1 Tax=Rhynchophorus ferrugineus TaxID=354439 RepID=A0A834M6C0_RHYFE|nr:hypothetical protein GWI33_013753 [Rhynchophorus ferrugineus]